MFPQCRPRIHRARFASFPRVLIVVGAALLSLFGALGLSVSVAESAGADNWSPVHADDFPDPTVICVPTACGVGATYYAFSTQNFAPANQTINIQESTSTNGVNWTPSNVKDALPQVGSWAKAGETWAPSVAFNGNEYVMYYAATEIRQPNDQCIGVATSSTPNGPYADPNAYPIVCEDGNGWPAPTIDQRGSEDGGGSIDPDVFTSHGSSYLLWKNDGNHSAMSTTIWSVPLHPDLLTPSMSTPTPLLTADAAWQANIIEGPTMYEHDVTVGSTTKSYYYLFYAGNGYASADYGIGWAFCPSGPTEACSDQSSSSPLFPSQQPGMSGPGGPDVFNLPPTSGQTGQSIMTFAAWQGTTIGYLSCGIRPMYEADLNFTSTDPPAPILTDPDPGVTPAVGPTCPAPPPQPPQGYWQVASDGGIFTFGAAQFYGSTGSIRLNKPVVGMAATPDGKGYWLVASDGGIFAYGDAQFHGSTGSMVLNKPIVGMVPTVDGGGYWLIASDGGVFAFGDAPFLGSTGANAPPYPITAAAPGYLGGGYWVVDANGQVFNYGDAPPEGSPSSAPDAYTISGIAPTHDDHGYWLSSWNGNVADFGDAAHYGSMYGTNLNSPVVGISATSDGAGYWLQGSDGGIFTFGNAQFLGSMGGRQLNAPMVGITSM